MAQEISGVISSAPPPAPIPVNEPSQGVGIFGHVDYLYWTSQTTDFPICIVGDVAGGSSFSMVNQSILSIPLGWASGFSVGLGFDVPTLDWAVSAEWTRFHNSGTRSLSTTLPNSGTPTSGRLILPIWAQNGYLPALLKGYQYLHFDTVDLVLKTTSLKTDLVEFKMFGGVKLAYINQKLVVNTLGSLLSGSFFPEAFENSWMFNRFKGAGVEVGGSGFFPFKWGFGANFEGVFALLAGAYSLNYNDQINFTGGSTSIFNEQGWAEKSIALAVDVRAQLFWEKRFSKYRRVKIFSGFDLSYWPDQILVTHTVRGSSNSVAAVPNLSLGHGNLSLYGYRFGADFGF